MVSTLCGERVLVHGKGSAVEMCNLICNSLFIIMIIIRIILLLIIIRPRTDPDIIKHFPVFLNITCKVNLHIKSVLKIL